MSERLGPRPDRVATWAFALGILLILIAIATANARRGACRRRGETPLAGRLRIRSCRAPCGLHLHTVRKRDARFRLPRPLAVAMPKTQMSRFHIHDELSAPEGSLPVLKSALVLRRPAPELPRRPGRLPAALRGYTRFRGELRHGSLAPATLERIALAVADHYRSVPGLTIHTRTARQAGVGIDEVGRAREWDSRTRARRRCCAI